MELAGTFVREIITLAGYAMILAAVYKLFQVATDLAEIKDLLKRGHTFGITPGGTPQSVREFTGEDAYAANLLKTLHPETTRE